VSGLRRNGRTKLISNIRHRASRKISYTTGKTGLKLEKLQQHDEPETLRTGLLPQQPPIYLNKSPIRQQLIGKPIIHAPTVPSGTL